MSRKAQRSLTEMRQLAFAQFLSGDVWLGKELLALETNLTHETHARPR